MSKNIDCITFYNVNINFDIYNVTYYNIYSNAQHVNNTASCLEEYKHTHPQRRKLLHIRRKENTEKSF